MQSGPREILTPFRPIPLAVPEGMKPNEFFNSAENLADLVHNNGLLRNPEGLLLYRKALGHSNEFDCSIIYDTSQRILDPLGRPVRRTQVPGIRMLHNHFIVFDQAELRAAPLADADNPNLTDGGQHSLFQAHMREVYRAFFDGLDLRLLRPCEEGASRIALTGYPQGLPSWEIQGGAAALKEVRFWKEYDTLLKGFNDFLKTAKMVRERCITDARYANAIRWQPDFKQLIYRNDEGRLVVTISQNAIGNAITELLGVVVKRAPDADAYGRAEPTPTAAPSRR